MANFINFADPVTTGAPMSTLIDKTRCKAEPLEGVLAQSGSGVIVPTIGQLWPRGVNTN